MPIGPHSSIVVAAFLVGGVPLPEYASAWLEMTPREMLFESATVGATVPARSLIAKQSVDAIRPILATPALPSVPSLMVSYSPGKSGARMELGALGAGRVDAPGLVHLDLALNF